MPRPRSFRAASCWRSSRSRPRSPSAPRHPSPASSRPGCRRWRRNPELETVSVALDWYPNANHAGLYLAQERGYYAEEGLAPEFYTPSDPTTVLQTVGAGRDDFGISYQTDILLARAAGVPVVSVLALVQTPLQGIMVLADSGITRPRDLVGKTVGYPGIPSQEAFLATMLEDDGATMDDVDLVNIDFNLVPGLISGQVDASLGAFWTHEPILAEQEGYPTNFLKVDDWGVPPYYELVIAASEATVSERSELVERFLRATRRGYEDAIADPAAAIAALRAASPDLNVAVEEAGIALLVPAWTAGGVPFGTQTAAALGRLRGVDGRARADPGRSRRCRGLARRSGACRSNPIP